MTGRVWLAGMGGLDVAPVDVPVVRDDQDRHWHAMPDGTWCTPDGRHHQTWAELHARTDLVEVTTAKGVV